MYDESAASFYLLEVSVVLILIVLHYPYVFQKEIDISSGNFFQPAIHKLLASCTRYLKENNCDVISTPLKKMVDILKLRFGLCFKLALEHEMDSSSAVTASGTFYGSNKDEVDKGNELKIGECSNKNSLPMNSNYRFDPMLDEDVEGEDGPVIVPYKEIEASLDRSSLLSNQKHFSIDESARNKNLERAYPCLFAAKATNPHEDIFMTCARILESASDVSLVREAAAYLEELEKSS